MFDWIRKIAIIQSIKSADQICPIFPCPSWFGACLVIYLCLTQPHPSSQGALISMSIQEPKCLVHQILWNRLVIFKCSWRRVWLCENALWCNVVAILTKSPYDCTCEPTSRSSSPQNKLTYEVLLYCIMNYIIFTLLAEMSRVFY